MQGIGSDNASAGGRGLRHGLAFLLSGGLAFTADAITLKTLTVLFGLNPMFARLFAISLAMLVGWLAHRSFTFALRVPPSLAEFLRYAVVGWSVAAVNYGLFVLLLLLWPAAEPLIALVVSSLFATLFAYVGMRYGAFRVHRG
jgi:putative flippase GtrA